jgi:hypothetical protein
MLNLNTSVTVMLYVLNFICIYTPKLHFFFVENGDRRLSAKLVPTFCGYRVPHGQRDGSLSPYSRLSRQAVSINMPILTVK